MEGDGRVRVVVYSWPPADELSVALCEELGRLDVDARPATPGDTEPSDADAAVLVWTPDTPSGLEHLMERVDAFRTDHRIVVVAEGQEATRSLPDLWAAEHRVVMSPGVGMDVDDLARRLRFVASVPRRFSTTVRAVRDELGPGVARESHELIAALQRRHPEYADGRFGALDVAPGRVRFELTVDGWLMPMTEFWSSEDVIHGRAVLVSLVDRDPDAMVILQPIYQDLVRELAQEQQQPQPISRRDDVRWIPDDPAARDALQREPVAVFIERQLDHFRERHGDQSFLILLDGPWGAGKSTILGFVEKRVRVKDWLVVRFDAWRQSKAGPPWLLLLHALRAALRREHPHPRLLRLRERRRLMADGYTWGLALLAAAAVGIGAAVWTGGDVSVARASDVFGVATAGAGLAGLAWTGGRALSRTMALDSLRRSQTFELHQPDPMEALARHFTWLVRQADSPVLFLIDDLDRCDERYVVDLLDAVQKLVREEPEGVDGRAHNVVFLVAADGRWVRHSYELAHHGFSDAVGEAGRPLGSLFLDKLFQLTVPVPTMGRDLQRSFLAEILDAGEQADGAADPALVASIQQATGQEVVEVLKAASPAERAKVATHAIEQILRPESQQHTENELVEYDALLERNPRSMKRFVMAYNTLQAVSFTEGKAIPIERLALWTILTLRWPLLAEYLAQHPEAVRYFRRPPDALSPWVPPPLRTLFTDPPDELVAVVNDPRGPLDEAAIRECCGYDIAEATPA